MTALSQRKSKLQFTTDAAMRYRGKMRPLVVEVPQGNGYTATIRLQGTRTRYPFSWTTVFEVAAEIAARKLREERKLARQQKRRK